MKKYFKEGFITGLGALTSLLVSGFLAVGVITFFGWFQ